MHDGIPISQIYTLFSQKNDLLHRFASLQNGYSAIPHEFGSAFPLSMAEIHTLKNIEDTPGVTVTELAASGRKTKGAVSQIVKKLEKRGYVFRKRYPVDGKRALLHASEEGRRLCRHYKRRDLANLKSILDGLLKHCDMAEVDAFFKVTAVYVALLEDETAKMHTP